MSNYDLFIGCCSPQYLLWLIVIINQIGHSNKTMLVRCNIPVHTFNYEVPFVSKLNDSMVQLTGYDLWAVICVKIETLSWYNK